MNNFDFSPLSFSTVSKSAFFVPASLSFPSACSFSSDVNALSHISLSDPAKVCDGSIWSSNVYPSESICPSKPVCLNSVRPSKPIILTKKKFIFHLSKPVCPRNINSSRSIRSSNFFQSRSNVSPSKPVRKPVWKPVCPSNATPSKPVCPSNDSLSKTACPSKVYSSKPVCPCNIYPSKNVCLSDISK